MLILVCWMLKSMLPNLEEMSLQDWLVESWMRPSGRVISYNESHYPIISD